MPYTAAMISRVCRAGAGLVLVSALLGGCGGDGDGPTSPEAPTSQGYDASDADFEAVTAVLDERAEAILSGDEQAFRDTLDDRDREFVERQLQVYENLRALPVESVEYRTESYGLPPADVPGDEPTLRPAATELVQLDGPDRRPVANQTDMTFVLRDGEWLLAAEEAPESDPMTIGSRVWFGGPIEVAVRGDLVVVVTPGDQDARWWAGSVRQQLSSLARTFGIRRRTNLLVDGSRHADEIQMNGLGAESAAAVTFPVGDGDQLSGLRIAINPEASEQLDEHTFDQLVTHELVHFALWRFNGNHVPLWVTEGIAEHASGHLVDHDGLPKQLRTRILRARHELPESGSFSTYPDRNYVIAAAAVNELVDRRGMAHFMKFLRAFPRDGYGDDETETLLPRFYDLTEAELAAAAFRRIEQAPGF